MFDKVKSDLIVAMKDKDKFKLDVIRMLKSAIQMEAISVNHELSDDEVLGVIKREVKKRKSSVEEYAKYGKDEMVESINKEIEILNVYLPEELSEEKIIEIAEATIAEMNATPKEMGLVIKAIVEKYGAQVDKGLLARIVKEKLN